jgi:hypothetical protein
MEVRRFLAAFLSLRDRGAIPQLRGRVFLGPPGKDWIMAKFMLILHKTPGIWRQLSPEEMQRKAEKYQAWMDKIHSSGRHVSSEKLGEEGGKLLGLQKGHLTIVDGPYSEAKEVVGGYFVFRAANYEEAIELTRDCPFLDDGRIELRQTDPMGCGGE